MKVRNKLNRLSVKKELLLYLIVLFATLGCSLILPNPEHSSVKSAPLSAHFRPISMQRDAYGYRHITWEFLLQSSSGDIDIRNAALHLELHPHARFVGGDKPQPLPHSRLQIAMGDLGPATTRQMRFTLVFPSYIEPVRVARVSYLRHGRHEELSLGDSQLPSFRRATFLNTWRQNAVREQYRQLFAIIENSPGKS